MLPGCADDGECCTPRDPEPGGYSFHRLPDPCGLGLISTVHPADRVSFGLDHGIWSFQRYADTAVHPSQPPMEVDQPEVDAGWCPYPDPGLSCK